MIPDRFLTPDTQDGRESSMKRIGEPAKDA
jgi:hypothetical protein